MDPTKKDHEKIQFNSQNLIDFVLDHHENISGSATNIGHIMANKSIVEAKFIFEFSKTIDIIVQQFAMSLTQISESNKTQSKTMVKATWALVGVTVVNVVVGLLIAYCTSH